MPVAVNSWVCQIAATFDWRGEEGCAKTKRECNGGKNGDIPGKILLYTLLRKYLVRLSEDSY
jgi:hypothetical protein